MNSIQVITNIHAKDSSNFGCKVFSKVLCGLRQRVKLKATDPADSLQRSGMITSGSAVVNGKRANFVRPVTKVPMVVTKKERWQTAARHKWVSTKLSVSFKKFTSSRN